MKKLHYLSLALLLISLPFKAPAYAFNESPEAFTHLAKFHVFDFTTKVPIDHATVIDQTGNELGFTSLDGTLSLAVPSNTDQFYTVSAEGYLPMNFRLTEADKNMGVYEIYLPSQELGYKTLPAQNPEPIAPDTKPDRVKVYVKQDPATYHRKNNQAGEIAFSVQISASSRPVSETEVQKEWSDLGKVYVQKENGMYKVRIGPFETQLEAKKVLLNVKSKGRKDAFIVVHQNDENDAPVLDQIMHENKAAPVENVPVPATTDEYKIRIASYLHPGAFNTQGIDQLGTLESYRKGEWTIMMIGGFKSLDQAKNAKAVVVSKGYHDATIVVDRNGILETIE